MELSPRQAKNRQWWESNPMTYDWEKTLRFTPGSVEWFEEIDRRFFSASYFAKDKEGRPFGRFLRSEFVEGKEVLEIGCGMGAHAVLLVKAVVRLTAVDLTEKAVEITRRRFQLFKLNGRIERADAERLPFTDNSFDVVWSWGVIHHSNSMESCLSEIARVLRPGARLMIMVYYRPSIVYYVNCGLVRGILLGQLRKKSLHQIYEDSTDGSHARVFNRRELRHLLSSDFSNIELSVVGLKGELFPIPRTRFKQALENATPDCLASAVLRHWGAMVIAEATRNF
jgi:ubiquinone/menaquinone biosynthesis C-methylase UbiE